MIELLGLAVLAVVFLAFALGLVVGIFKLVFKLLLIPLGLAALVLKMLILIPLALIAIFAIGPILLGIGLVVVLPVLVVGGLVWGASRLAATS